MSASRVAPVEPGTRAELATLEARIITMSASRAASG